MPGYAEQRFTTSETLLSAADDYCANGERVPYNPHKLRISLERVLHKRPFQADDIERLVAVIEQRLHQLAIRKCLR